MTGRESAADASQRDRVRPYAGPPPRTTNRSTWTGWIVFAAVLLLVGLFQVMQGLVALFDDGSPLPRGAGPLSAPLHPAREEAT
jgi:hypothetical protein